MNETSQTSPSSFACNFCCSHFFELACFQTFRNNFQLLNEEDKDGERMQSCQHAITFGTEVAAKHATLMFWYVSILWWFSS